MANVKSSDAVFTRQNPFPPDLPPGKARYHPSRIQRLPKKNRKTTLSPLRLNQPASPPSEERSLGPEDLCFVEKTQQLVAHYRKNDQPSFSESWPSTDMGTPPPNERSLDVEAHRKPAPTGKSSTSKGDQQDSVLAKYIERFRHGQPQSREERQQITSTLGEEEQPFWWMSLSSLASSSTSSQPTDKELYRSSRNNHKTSTLSPVSHFQHDSDPSPHRELLDLSALGLSDTSQCDIGDSEILQLQERANRLLNKSQHSTCSESVPVSTEGLGSSTLSPFSVDEPIHIPMFPTLLELSNVNASSASPPVDPPQNRPMAAYSVSCKRPEEDILFQWRLRRKMEQARQTPHSPLKQCSGVLNQPMLTGLNTSFHQSSVIGHTHQEHQHQDNARSVQPHEHPPRVTPSSTPASKQESKENHGMCPPTIPPSLSHHHPVSSLTVSKLQTATPVPSHMHLLCDVLPCPALSSQHAVQQKSSDRLHGSLTKMASKKSHRDKANSTDTSTEEPSSKHESYLPSASSGTSEEEWAFQDRRSGGAQERKNEKNLRKSENKEKRAGVSSRKQKKSVRHHIGDGDHAKRTTYSNRNSSCRNRDSEKVSPWTEQPSRDEEQQEKCQELSREGRPGDCAPPPSPIHSALGQVVSEVLFPASDSPPVQRTPVSSDSSQYTPPAPPQSPVPLANVQQPMEVITQLLQDAEDSDEKEFEDDPLLQVLRKQRKQVKEQIREVDSMLDEFFEE